ncbi:MAG: hypothetical protein COV45_05650 [Deltaproteobacteria bacterium CG11_big_fil_rev_8_21_14_0_20_47_16]|nr:MAG: hypothetical protein COV45_05650 [Deltaproteobacteria bacterium CG11_big_fil_rev_8_21_14_0_20_47_16]
MKIPLVIAHRGANREAPENTLPAFERALEMGVDGIECDVMLTSDKVPVITHDDSLSKHSTTYGHIHKTTYKSLKTVDVGSHFSSEFAGVRIPTLSEMLALFRPTSMLLNIEIKVQPQIANGVEKIVADTIHEFGMDDQVIISSFSPMILWRIKQCAPHLRRALLTQPRAFFFLHMRFFAKVLDVWGVNPSLSAADQKLEQLARDNGWSVMVWTLNTTDAFAKAASFGVDGIITDDPPLLQNWLRTNQFPSP